jgi:hypothetical protein
MNWLRPLTFLALVPAVAFCGELKARAFWSVGPEIQRYDVPLTEPAKVTVIVQLRNIGKDSQRVFCKMVEPFFGQTGVREGLARGIIVYRVNFDSGLGGVRVIPPMSEVRAVDLSPGEVTEFRFAVRLGPGSDLRGITLKYEVMEEFGRRFAGWFGALDIPVQLQTMNMAWDQ